MILYTGSIMISRRIQDPVQIRAPVELRGTAPSQKVTCSHHPSTITTPRLSTSHTFRAWVWPQISPSALSTIRESRRALKLHWSSLSFSLSQSQSIIMWWWLANDGMVRRDIRAYNSLMLSTLWDLCVLYLYCAPWDALPTYLFQVRDSYYTYDYSCPDPSKAYEYQMMLGSSIEGLCTIY